MTRIFVVILMVCAIRGYSQVSSSQQNALNNYVDYANKSAEEVTRLFNAIKSYYPDLKYYRQQKRGVRPFNCSDQLDDFFFNKATTESAALAKGASLNVKVRELRASAEKLDKLCKALDTYHKLEDYKQDNFKQAETLINQMQVSLVEYRQKQNILYAEVESTYGSLQGASAPNACVTTEKMMRKEISRERAFLDLLSFNLQSDVHTGWPVDRLQSSILETDNAIAAFGRTKPALKYPANTMYDGFAESLGSLKSTKQSGLDGYNFEAKKSDEHSNDVYLDLINYFNGTLVTDQNMFVQFAQRDGFHGLHNLNYVPLFEIRTTAQQANAEIVQFVEVPHSPLKIVKQNVAITNGTFTALGNYIEFINETLHQMGYLERVLRNYNSSARYYKDLTTYKGKGGLTYEHKDFQPPLSLYQTLKTQSASVPAAYRKSLNDQADELLGILKEMDQLSIELTVDASEKRYEKDNLKRAYEILLRYEKLFEISDVIKEQLYDDVRAVFESYSIANPASSWIVSNKALLGLVDEDKAQLFKAKAYLRGDLNSVPSSTEINQELRDVIAKEFDNMKGIERYGRYNGLCPYSPYEDIPANSRTLGEKFLKIKTMKSNYGGPDYDYVYLYNSIVGDYNKFCELAKVSLLKNVRQIEMFIVKYPEKKEPTREDDLPQATSANAPSGSFNQQKPSSESPIIQPERTTGRVIHDTVKVTDIIRIETRRQDTVYIEKHDTIYVGKPGENTMSMEGYPANNLVFLLDVSGSMNSGQKLPLLKKSMLLLLNILRTEDNVAIVIYSGSAKIALSPTSAKEKEKISNVIENLKSKGETDGNAGIKMAYKVANGNYIRGGNNRIILATDGEFPISDEVMNMVGRFSREDIYISVFNFGGAASAQSLEKLCSLGKGNYENIIRANCDVKLIREAKARK